MAYLSLSTSNLPDPGVDPNAAEEPRDYFETFLYTGNGTGLQVGDLIKKPADTTTISNSLIFDDGSSTYLSGGVPGTSSSTYTLSMWFKRATITSGNYQYLFYTHSNGGLSIGSTAGQVDEMYVYNQGGGDVQYLGSGRKIKDTSKWYHVVMKVSSNSATVYLDGLQLGTATAGTVTSAARIGSYNASNYFDGYLAEIHFVDGTAHEPTDFGNFDANGIWIPKAVTGITYGTNGFYLDFSDNTSTTTLGADQTANGNDWTLNNFATTDQVTDSPTNNFETLQSSNAVDLLGAATISEGNLRATSGGSNSRAAIGQTFVTSGKWYAEVTITTSVSDYVGIGSRDNANSTYSQADKTGAYSYLSNGNKDSGLAAATSYGATYTSGDVIGIAYNADDGELTFYKNGASQGVAFTGIDTTIPRAFAGFNGGTGNYVHDWNFGQKGFTYTPPTGYLALSENNITVDDQNLESPDLVWIKNRDTTDPHHWYDSVRGVQKALYSNATTLQTDEPNGLLDFNKNGFTIGSEVEVNTANEDYVAWCWKAGGTASSNTDGSVTSTVSANSTSGISLVKWTVGSGTHTIGHGLGGTPDMLIHRSIDTAITQWWIWHVGLSNPQQSFIQFTTGAAGANTSAWVNTAPTSTVFTQDNYIHTAGAEAMAWCFRSVDGYSKFGSYEGNGSTNGPFVYTGFRPAFIMVKPTAAGAWLIHDVLRNTYNTSILELQADSSGAEYSTVTAGAGDRFDILSNGFKSRTANSGANAAGTYIYMAFAETPFKYATAR